MRRISAQYAVKRILAAGWHSDALAEDAATALLIQAGQDETSARAAVRAEIAKLQVLGPN